MTDNEEIGRFWAWFEASAESLRNPPDRRVLAELDRRVTALGFSWELGSPAPDSDDVGELALSPGGDPERLVATRAAVERAPRGIGWRFFPARQPKRWKRRRFVLDPGDRKVTIDASAWRYVLYGYDDGMFGLDLCIDQAWLAKEPAMAREAAALFLELELGEEVCIRWIAEIEVVSEVEAGHPSRPIEDLSDHVAQTLARHRHH